jgi:predicted lipid-binding transport protein (Tim44 family)
MQKNGTLWAILGAAVIIALVGWVMMSGKPMNTSETAAPAATSETTQPAPAEPPAAPAPAEQPAAPAPAPAQPVQ